MMLQISVIVPIFKAESTLFRCLDSLKAQTFRDFEVLMIDDGSPDCCGKMIDDYAQKDSRFKAFHKQNGGVSSARQYGIDHAQGVYTIHADPDDWVEPTMLEDLYLKAQEENADMVICDFYENTYKGQKYVKQQPSALDHQTVLKELFQQLHGSCCNKFVKRVCYSEYAKAYYHYVRNDNPTLSKSYSATSLKHDLLLREMFYNLLKSNELKSFVYQQKSYSIVSNAFWGGKNIYSSKDFKRLFSSYKNIIVKVSDYSVNKYILLLSCMGFYQPIINITHFLLKLKRIIYSPKK